jgi:GNAT superfamily N-acetyltransferase
MIKTPELELADWQYLTQHQLQPYLKDELFFVAECDSQIIGLIFWERLLWGMSIIWMLFVKESFRSKWVWSQLLQAFQEHAKNIWIEKVLLYGYADEPSTLQFYEKNWYTGGIICKEFLKTL